MPDRAFIWRDLRPGGASDLEPPSLAILYEPPIAAPGSPQPDSASLRAAFDEGGGEALLEEFLRSYVGIPPAAVAASRLDALWNERVALAPTILREVEVVSAYGFDAERFARVDVPVVVLLGERSPASMAATAHMVADAMPHGSLQVLPGQGHVAMLTAARLMAEAISSHIDLHIAAASDRPGQA